MNALLECAMEIGQMNFKVMSILDAGETTKYGHPTPTQVNVKATEGKWTTTFTRSTTKSWPGSALAC